MKVLLVEDSAAVTAYVESLLQSEPDIEWLPPAADGAAGVVAARRYRPDVILLDLELPVLDGVEAIREIMSTEPRPIVVLSSYLDAPDRDRTFESLEAGAAEVMAKPRGLDPESIRRFRRQLIGTLRLMANAQVVHRWSPKRIPPPPDALEPAPGKDVDLVVIGSSTGGPQVLRRLLEATTPPLSVPVAIAQHVILGFEAGLARWLAETGHRVCVAEDGATLSPGSVFVAPAHRHLVVRADGLRHVDPDPGGLSVVPSADRLFESAAETHGRRVGALLLTGMGEDGARGLLRLREAGAVTIAQHADTCVIDGMPGAARRLGAAAHSWTPHQIAAWLDSLAQPTSELAATAAPTAEPMLRSR